MFGFGNKTKKLEKKYQQLLEEAYQMSKSSRSKSDEKTAEATSSTRSFKRNGVKSQKRDSLSRSVFEGCSVPNCFQFGHSDSRSKKQLISSLKISLSKEETLIEFPSLAPIYYDFHQSLFAQPTRLHLDSRRKTIGMETTQLLRETETGRYSFEATSSELRRGS